VRRPTAVLAAALFLVLPAATAGAQATAPAEEAVVVINGDVVVDRGEVVEGVFIVNGDARIAGRVDGDVVLAAGDVVLGGRVDGNLVTIAGRATLLPRASVGGDLVYGDEEPRVSPRAIVEGEIEKEGWDDSLGLFPFIGAVVFWLAIGVSAAILGILLLLLAPRAADAAFEQARTRFWTAVGIGVAVFVAIPLAAFLAAITLVGLPLALALGLAMLPLLALGYVTAAWALGRAIVGPPRSRIVSFLAGLAILRAAAIVPVLGALVSFAAMIVGLGLLAAAITAAREPAAARAPGS
jgi:hypothetical protein